MDKKYQVFISSTYKDLKPARKKVMEAILSMGHFTVLRLDLEFCIHEHIIQFRKRKVDKNGQPIPPENKEDMVSTEEIEIFRLVAKIDSDMCRWWASLSKGKIMYGG